MSKKEKKNHVKCNILNQINIFKKVMVSTAEESVIRK